MAAKGSFSVPPSTHAFSGFLLDMDGTIIDSTEAIEKHWRKLGAELNFDAEVLLATSHGRRSIDTLSILAPEKANWEYISHIESLIPTIYGSSAHLVPGSQSLLDSLAAQSIPWAIVTSGTKALLAGWLKHASLPASEHVVTAEDVEKGKPDPACYLLGRRKIGQSMMTGDGDDGRHSILVCEDSPSGILAAKASACHVVAVATTHTIQSLLDAGADWVVEDLRGVRILGKTKEEEDRWEVEIGPCWVEVDEGKGKEEKHK